MPGATSQMIRQRGKVRKPAGAVETVHKEPVWLDRDDFNGEVPAKYKHASAFWCRSCDTKCGRPCDLKKHWRTAKAHLEHATLYFCPMPHDYETEPDAFSTQRWTLIRRHVLHHCIFLKDDHSRKQQICNLHRSELVRSEVCLLHVWSVIAII